MGKGASGAGHDTKKRGHKDDAAAPAALDPRLPVGPLPALPAGPPPLLLDDQDPQVEPVGQDFESAFGYQLHQFRIALNNDPGRPPECYYDDSSLLSLAPVGIALDEKALPFHIEGNRQLLVGLINNPDLGFADQDRYRLLLRIAYCECCLESLQPSRNRVRLEGRLRNLCRLHFELQLDIFKRALYLDPLFHMRRNHDSDDLLLPEPEAVKTLMYYDSKRLLSLKPIKTASDGRMIPIRIEENRLLLAELIIHPIFKLFDKDCYRLLFQIAYLECCLESSSSSENIDEQRQLFQRLRDLYQSLAHLYAPVDKPRETQILREKVCFYQEKLVACCRSASTLLDLHKIYISVAKNFEPLALGDDEERISYLSKAADVMLQAAFAESEKEKQIALLYDAAEGYVCLAKRLRRSHPCRDARVGEWLGQMSTCISRALQLQHPERGNEYLDNFHQFLRVPEQLGLDLKAPFADMQCSFMKRHVKSSGKLRACGFITLFKIFVSAGYVLDVRMLLCALIEFNRRANRNAKTRNSEVAFMVFEEELVDTFWTMDESQLMMLYQKMSESHFIDLLQTLAWEATFASEEESTEERDSSNTTVCSIVATLYHFVEKLLNALQECMGLKGIKLTPLTYLTLYEAEQITPHAPFLAPIRTITQAILRGELIMLEVPMKEDLSRSGENGVTDTPALIPLDDDSDMETLPDGMAGKVEGDGGDAPAFRA